MISAIILGIALSYTRIAEGGHFFYRIHFIQLSSCGGRPSFFDWLIYIRNYEDSHQKKHEVLEYIKQYLKTHRYAPSFKELWHISLSVHLVPSIAIFMC